MRDCGWLFGVVVACFGGVVATTYAIKFHDSMMKGRPSIIPMLPRWISSFRGTIAMTTSWLLLRLCFAIADKAFSSFDMHFVEVVSAFLLTALAILAIVLLEQVAEKVEHDAHLQDADEFQFVAPPPPPKQPTFFESLTAPCSSCGSEDQPTQMQMMQMQEMQMRQMKRQEEMEAAAMQSKNLEKAIRSIIGSFALAVGLAWEHAFHAATHTIIETVPVPLLQDYKIITKSGVALLSFCLMLPAWLKYIVPKAHMSVSKFTQLMQAERAFAPPPTASLSTDGDGNPFGQMFGAMGKAMPFKMPKLPGQFKVPKLKLPGQLKMPKLPGQFRLPGQNGMFPMPGQFQNQQQMRAPW